MLPLPTSQYRVLIAPALAIVAAITVMLAGTVTDLCRALAMIAAILAALERRHAAMTAGVALAIGMGVEGIALIPFAIGIAIQRRIGWRYIAPAPLAFALGLLVPTTAAVGPVGLWAALALLPDGGLSLAALVAATAVGSAAWYGAGLTAKPVAGAGLIDMASLGMIGFTLLAPVGVTALVAPMALAVLRKDRRVAVAIAAALIASAAGVPALTVLPLAGATVAQFFATRQRAANDNSIRAAFA